MYFLIICITYNPPTFLTTFISYNIKMQNVSLILLFFFYVLSNWFLYCNNFLVWCHVQRFLGMYNNVIMKVYIHQNKGVYTVGAFCLEKRAEKSYCFVNKQNLKLLQINRLSLFFQAQIPTFSTSGFCLVWCKSEIFGGFGLLVIQNKTFKKSSGSYFKQFSDMLKTKQSIQQ